MTNLLQLNTVDDVKKVLYLQKTISQRAKNEMLGLLSNDGAPDVEEFMEEGAEILKKYADHPTLTEFSLMPHLYDGSKWGATFGVTLLVGEFIIEKAKQMHPHFTLVLRQLFVLLLAELDDPKHQYLVEPLEKALHFEITSEDGSAVSEQRQRDFVRTLCYALIETFVVLGEDYGIIEENPTGYTISSTGKRVLLHLMDAAKFIEEMTHAHTKFQAVKPKLSMT